MSDFKIQKKDSNSLWNSKCGKTLDINLVLNLFNITFMIEIYVFNSILLFFSNIYVCSMYVSLVYLDLKYSIYKDRTME